MFPPSTSRPNILRLPKRDLSGTANIETAERDHAKEMAKLKARVGRLAATEDRLLLSAYALPEQARQAEEATRQTLDALRASQQEAAVQAAAAEDRWVRQPSTVPQQTDIPWSANTTTYLLSPAQEAQARKEMLRRDALVNRLAERQNSLESVKIERKQQDYERRELSTERSWWNRGASHDQWLPPDLRVKKKPIQPSVSTSDSLIMAHHGNVVRSRSQEGAGVAALFNSSPENKAKLAVTDHITESVVVQRSQPSRSYPWS